jgi:preprotein translocase subunit SecY
VRGITDKGIGNGVSLIIMIGIIARLPFALKEEFNFKLTESGEGLVIFFSGVSRIVWC